MKTKIAVAMIMALFLVAPMQAQSSFVDEFLKRYQPSVEPAQPNPTARLVQLAQTGELPLTMSDLVNLLLDSNLDIRSNRLLPRSSYLQSLVFHRLLQPSLSFSGNIGRNTSASTSQLNGAQVLSQLQDQFSLAFAQYLPTGTTVGATMTMNRASSNSNNSTFNPSYTGRVIYSLSQHFLRDRGRLINKRQILQAENDEKISEITFETQLITLMANAQKSYWDLVFAGEDLKVKQDSLALAQQTLEENKMRVEIGTMAPIDVVQTQVDVASRREQLVLSTYNITAAEDQIKKMISSNDDPSMFLIKLRAAETPRGPAGYEVPNLADAVRIALENRPEMRSAAIELKNNDIDVQYTKNQKLPILDVTATYTQNGVGGTQTIRTGGIGGQVQQIIPGGVWNSFQQLFGYNYTGSSIGFSFVLPLSNKAAKADYSRALNERELTSSKMTSTAQQIALDVRNALTQVEMNRARIETAQTTRQLSEQTLEAEQTKLSLGTSTLRFVLEDQRNVAIARTNELAAMINFTKSTIDLDRAMGMTLKKNNIELDKALPSVFASNTAAPSGR